MTFVIRRLKLYCYTFSVHLKAIIDQPQGARAFQMQEMLQCGDERPVS